MKTLSTPPRSATVEAVTNTLFQFLAVQPTPVGERFLLKSVRGRKQLKVFALRTLVANGKVLRTGAGKRGDPYRYFVPSPASQSSQSAVEEMVI